jgi:hypothetical protein
MPASGAAGEAPAEPAAGRTLRGGVGTRLLAGTGRRMGHHDFYSDSVG